MFQLVFSAFKIWFPSYSIEYSTEVEFQKIALSVGSLKIFTRVKRFFC